MRADLLSIVETAYTESADDIPRGPDGQVAEPELGHFYPSVPTLVDHFDHDGRRYLMAKRNAPALRPWHTLAEREGQAVAYAAHGQPNKVIAYELGVALSTVASDLSRAAKKVGARSRLDLMATYRRAHPEMARP